MTTLTVEFKGVTEDILNELIKRGFAKTKTEALRYCLLQVGEELDLTKKKIHSKAEIYAYQEIKRRFE